MNVLEKILEEIKQYTEDVYECDLDDIVEYQRRNREDNCTYIVQGIEEATEFIRSHMDEINTLKKKPVWEIDVMHHESYDLGRNIGWNECLETIEYIENDGWIPTQVRLPEENNKLRYDMQLVTLEDGEVCLGVYNNQENKWYTRRQEGEEWYTNKRNVVAWQPLPEAYEPLSK